jgi:hypothetical protein
MKQAALQVVPAPVTTHGRLGSWQGSEIDGGISWAKNVGQHDTEWIGSNYQLISGPALTRSVPLTIQVHAIADQARSQTQ